MAWSGLCAALSGALARKFGLCIALIGSGVAAFYTARFAKEVIVFSSFVGGSNFLRDSIKDKAGDTITVSTCVSGRRQDPCTIDIRLKPARHWFSTTLLKAKSHGFRWDAKWRDSNALDLIIDFGCAVQVSRPIAKAGSLHISHRFTCHDKSLDLDLAGWAPSDRSACQKAHPSGPRIK